MLMFIGWSADLGRRIQYRAICESSVRQCVPSNYSLMLILSSLYIQGAEDDKEAKVNNGDNVEPEKKKKKIKLVLSLS